VVQDQAEATVLQEQAVVVVVERSAKIPMVIQMRVVGESVF
jgi:hypothetical protein